MLYIVYHYCVACSVLYIIICVAYCSTNSICGKASTLLIISCHKLHFNLIIVVLQHYSADSPQVLSVVKNLAPVCKKMQKWHKAAPLYKQIVELREKTAGDKSDPSLATALVNLAVIYCHMVCTVVFRYYIFM